MDLHIIRKPLVVWSEGRPLAPPSGPQFEFLVRDLEQQSAPWWLWTSAAAQDVCVCFCLHQLLPGLPLHCDGSGCHRLPRPAELCEGSLFLLPAEDPISPGLPGSGQLPGKAPERCELSGRCDAATGRVGRLPEARRRSSASPPADTVSEFQQSRKQDPGRLGGRSPEIFAFHRTAESFSAVIINNLSEIVYKKITENVKTNLIFCSTEH